MPKRCPIAQMFPTKNALTRENTAIRVEPPVRIELTTARLQDGLVFIRGCSRLFAGVGRRGESSAWPGKIHPCAFAGICRCCHSVYRHLWQRLVTPSRCQIAAGPAARRMASTASSPPPKIGGRPARWPVCSPYFRRSGTVPSSPCNDGLSQLRRPASSRPGARRHRAGGAAGDPGRDQNV